jgi:conjugal transfer mating pair stabilization protein TraN
MKYNFRVNKIIFIFIMLLACGGYSYANNSNFDSGFAQGIKTATALQEKPYSAIQNFKPDSFINGYSKNPTEAAYQNNPDSIKNDAVQSRNSDSTGQSIVQGMNDRKKQFNYPIDPNSTAVQNIMKRADDVYDVVTGEFSDCIKQTSCSTNYETNSCEESPKNTYQYCRKTLNIDLIPKQIDTHYSLTAHITTEYHDYAGVLINLVNGQIIDSGPHDASASLTGRLPANLDCHGLQGKVTQINSRNPNTSIDGMNFPSCASGLTLNLHVSNKGRKGIVSIDIQMDIVSSKIVQEPHDRWDDECTGLENTTSCTLKEEHCIGPQSTRNIQGIPVTRDCWEKEDNYQCGGGVVSTSCQNYRDQGCEQISSICENKTDGGCALYQQTFRCPIKQCTDVGVICNGQTYCLSGDCVKQQKQADPDFQKGVSGLSAVNEAAKSYVQNPGSQFPIFSGQVKTCNKDFLGFANCCSDNGWGFDLHLAQCDNEAKELGKAKENGLTVYIDSDDDCVLGLCSHKKRYCVFPSKLARIIQEQGRREQLHIAFGNYDHPDCRGITPDELSHLDLNKVDFTEIYADITKKEHVEDQDLLNQRMKDKMTTWSEGKTPHG